VNARTQKWGTWIFSAGFFASIIVSGAATGPVFMIVMLSSVASPPSTLALRLLVTYGVLWILLPGIAYGALHLWQKTRFPWLAVIPVPITLATMWVAASFIFGWT
jgi:glucan phosphoethanolaminetransferase (alkaline phosphatase superfamily)